MDTFDRDFLLASIVLGLGAISTFDLRKASRLTGRDIEVTAWTLTSTIATFADMVWSIYGFFVVKWWVAALSIAAPVVLWTFVVPATIRYGKWLPALGTTCSLVGLLQAGVFIWQRHFH